MKTAKINNTTMRYAIVKTETGDVNIIKYSAYDPEIHDLDSVFDTMEEAKYFLNMLSELNLRNS